MRRALPLLVCCAAVLSAPAATARFKANQLLRAVGPAGRPAAAVPPVARALVGSDVLVSDVPLQLDGTQSSDPEKDALTYHWDFGDGTTSDDPQPVHVFRPTEDDVTVRLTVSDGQLDGHDQVTMLA